MTHTGLDMLKNNIARVRMALVRSYGFFRVRSVDFKRVEDTWSKFLRRRYAA